MNQVDTDWETLLNDAYSPKYHEIITIDDDQVDTPVLEYEPKDHTNMDSTQNTNPLEAVITDHQFGNCLQDLWFGAISNDEHSD